MTFTMRITDDLSGFDGYGVVRLRSPSGDQKRCRIVYVIDAVWGDALDGVYEVAVTIPQYAEAGIWRYGGSRLGITAGNQIRVTRPSLIPLGFPTRSSRRVRGDLSAPELTGFSFAPSIGEYGWWFG